MEQYEKTIIPKIESLYENFTPLERTIADFFIHNTEEMDFSSKSISEKLFVSEASLSRFSKKCGFKGYREFIFEYKQGLVKKPCNFTTDCTKNVLNTYQELLNKSYTLLDETQMERITELFTKRRGFMFMVWEVRHLLPKKLKFVL
ncbi:MurR/RpiR family transcriptional regulator [Clostridium sp.]|uniref:MurR/RpiR family transcriptional regulator n=1 Tax=Clostridium sp. TaxID=1506 RepID=UPI0039F5F9D6